MASTRAANVITVTGTEVIPGPICITSIQNSATTSFSIVKNGVTVLSALANSESVMETRIRSAGPITVTVVGGGSISLILSL